MADVKISQLILMDSSRSLPITNAIIDSDQLIVNDVSSLVTKRVKIHDIIYIRNRNIEDTPTGSAITGNLAVSGDVTFGGDLEDGEGNKITDLSTLVTQTELTTILETLLGSDGEGGIATLNCLRDSTPTRSGGGCGVTVTGELTVDSDLYVSGVLYGDGVGLTNIQYALAADSADHARFSLLAQNAIQSENAVRADSAFHSLVSDVSNQISVLESGVDGTFYLTFVGLSSGIDSVNTDASLFYNPNDNILDAGFFRGDGRFLTNVVASAVSSELIYANASDSDDLYSVMFRLDPTGLDSTNTDGSFLYNPSKNLITGTTETDLFLYGGSQWTKKVQSKSATGLNYLTMKSSTLGLDSVAVASGLTYDATSETLSASFFEGDGSLITNVDAVTATTATNVLITNVIDDAIYYVHLGSSTSGGDGVNIDTSLRYNPSLNKLSLVSDTNSITFGADSDLSVYHDGSNAYIDIKTGALNIRKQGGGTNVILLENLPTTDTGLSAGQIWNEGGFLRISSGS